MWSLRWVLLGLGALLVVGIYVWGRGLLRRPRSEGRRPARVEPTVLEEPDVEPIRPEEPDIEPAIPEEPDLDPIPAGFEAAPELERDGVSELEDPEPAAAASSADEPAPPDAERVVTVRLVSKGAPLNGQTVVLAMRAAGLRHGRYGIFHRMPESDGEEPLFSVANLTEPGSFDLTNLAESTLPGMSFFMLLPGAGDPVERFDMMVDTARSLARELEAELHDDRGSTWSIQRERYVREQIIEYRYQLDRTRASKEA